MKPKYPFTQPFDKLPGQLPIYPFENALLPGGEMPLELSKPDDLALFFSALRSDQTIGMVQPRLKDSDRGVHSIGCAGRIRQYRERKDGRLNVMLTGVCRYRIIELIPQKEGYSLARVEWRGFENDYENEVVDPKLVDDFKKRLRNYFDRHSMQVDWKVLDENPVEQVVNNLVLVVNLDIESKQRLLEAPTLPQRVALFSTLLEGKGDPIRPTAPGSNSVN